MKGRVILVDDYGEGSIVAAELADTGLEVEQVRSCPVGEGIVALLAGPDVPVGPVELAALPDLRIVAATSTGFDHLDLDAIRAAGIYATHVAGYCDEEVAEHVIAMSCSLLRGLHVLDPVARQGRWYDYGSFPPRRIAGARMGIAGFGRIGREVAVRALALGFVVSAYDPFADADAMRAARVERVVDLTTLAATSDVLTLHAALSDATREMIGCEVIAAMPPGSFIVNCARAGLIDHDALGEAIRSGHLGGAALDVFPVEPPRPDDPVFGWPRTLVTPHAAWYSSEAAKAPYQRAARQALAVLEGREPDNTLVSPRR
jgi:D-3-phosphoglycerate dehydrogenase